MDLTQALQTALELVEALKAERSKLAGQLSAVTARENALDAKEADLAARIASREIKESADELKEQISLSRGALQAEMVAIEEARIKLANLEATQLERINAVLDTNTTARALRAEGRLMVVGVGF
jgi:K+-transporting ATPase c subunit